MSIHKCKTKVNKQLHFTNIKTLNSQVPRTCKLMSTHKCQTKASTQLQFTSAKTLQTVANKHVPNQTLPMPMINQSLQTTLIHKCKYLANCCQFTSANTFQTVANSPVPIPCNPLPICKCKYLANFPNSQVPIPCKLLPVRQCQNLANCCQFTIANPELAHCFNSHVPRLCKLITTHTCPTKACKQLQFTRANTLQPVATSQVQNQSLQELARSCTLLQFTSASASFPVPKPCKLLPIHNSQPRACTLLQFTSAKTLQTDNNSQMPTKSLQAASIHQCQYLATRCHFTSVKPKPASAKNLPAALNSSLDRSP